jgi:drug/metabolite transporter (DMT)-like permease
VFRSRGIQGIAIGLIGTFMHTIVSIISKIAFNVVSRDMFLVVMYGVATIITLAYILITKQTGSLKLPKEQFLPTVLVGVFYFIGATSYFLGIQITDPALISFFGRLQTVYVVIFGVIFLKERLKRGEIAGMVVTLAGALIITYASGQKVFFAFLLALLGESLFNALGMVGTKVAVSRGTPGMAVIFWRSLICFVLTTLFALVRGQIGVPTVSGVGWSVIAALVGPIGAFIFFTWALRLIAASKMGIIRNIQPVLTVLLSLLILNTIPTLRQLIGGAVSLAGVMIIIQTQLRGRSKPAEAESASS